MPEAIESALANNLAVHSAAERARGSGARTGRRGVSAPQLDLSEIYSYTNNPAEVFAFQLNQERFSFEDFVTTDPNTPIPLHLHHQARADAPIYTGGQLGTRVDQADHMATPRSCAGSTRSSRWPSTPSRLHQSREGAQSRSGC